jgi:hypothetical protein
MRRRVLVYLLCVSLAHELMGCVAPPPKDLLSQCEVEPSSGWVQLKAPPTETRQILGTENALRKNSVWFRSTDGQLRFCQYRTASSPRCEGTPSFDDYQQANGVWRSIRAAGTVCPERAEGLVE